MNFVVSTGEQNWVLEVRGQIPSRGTWSNLGVRWKPNPYSTKDEKKTLLQGNEILILFITLRDCRVSQKIVFIRHSSSRYILCAPVGLKYEDKRRYEENEDISKVGIF